MFFHKKKKKNHALMVVAIVFASLAAVAGAYVLFTKVLKDKLCKKKTCNCGPDCTCGCNEGKECTCEGDCDCGCNETEECTCTCECETAEEQA